MLNSYIALGSNLENNLEQPKKNILSAIQKIKNTKNIKLLKTSSLYKTKPVGFLQQPDFINAVIKIQTNIAPLKLLYILQNIELAHGRKRHANSNRNGPRTLDLDLLLYGDYKIKSNILTIPHPRMYQRRFVLEPLYEIMLS